VSFSRKGDIIDLPSMTPTVLLIRYTDGTSLPRKISGKLVALDYTLRTGDKVEIMIAKRGGPSRDWLNPNLNLVKTQRALSKIRQWFRRQAREQNSEQGKVILEKELRHLGLIEVNLDRLARQNLSIDW
jgi:GTP pyrophosphokinase